MYDKFVVADVSRIGPSCRDTLDAGMAEHVFILMRGVVSRFRVIDDVNLDTSVFRSLESSGYVLIEEFVDTDMQRLTGFGIGDEIE